MFVDEHEETYCRSEGVPNYGSRGARWRDKRSFKICYTDFAALAIASCANFANVRHIDIHGVMDRTAGLGLGKMRVRRRRVFRTASREGDGSTELGVIFDSSSLTDNLD